jgi:hypothetical protein
MKDFASKIRGLKSTHFGKWKHTRLFEIESEKSYIESQKYCQDD